MDAGDTNVSMRGGHTPGEDRTMSPIVPPAQPPFEPAARLHLRPTNPEEREREQLLDRLQSLRRALPVLAQEMAAARRQAARLRSDNRKLSEQVRRLRTTLEARDRRAP
jgi:hypothetical protein